MTNADITPELRQALHDAAHGALGRPFEELTRFEVAAVAFMAGCELVERRDGLIIQLALRRMVTLVPCPVHGFDVYERRHDA